MKIRFIFKLHPDLPRFTLFHVVYKGGKRRFSLSLEPVLYREDTLTLNTAYTIAGIRINVKRSGGGYFV